MRTTCRVQLRKLKEARPGSERKYRMKIMKDMLVCCTECSIEVDDDKPILRIGKGGWDEETAHVCLDCARKAVALLEEETQKPKAKYVCPDCKTKTKIMTWGTIPPLSKFKNTLTEYSMELVKDDFDFVQQAINQGIDSHLEAVHWKSLRHTSDTGKTSIVIKELTSTLTLVRRLSEMEEERARDLATGIMYTLGIEWC